MSTVRLPLGYRRVEYILNSNNTYINTGIYLSSDDHVIVNFGVNSTAARDRYLFGARPSQGNSFWCNAYNGLANKGGILYPRFGSLSPSGLVSNGSLEIIERVWYFGDNSKTFDGTSASEFLSSVPCTLLGREGETNNNSDLMLSRFFIAGKFDGYACINQDGEAGIYDIQSQSFFKSPEGIAFVAGPLIEEEGFFQFADSRRRMMMENQHYPYEDYITIRTRTYNASTQYNISYDSKLFSEMVIDGQVLAPVRLYNFGDNAYHIVRLKAKDMTAIKAAQFQASNYCYNYVRIPAGVKTIEAYGLRYLGASQAVTVIFEDKVPPTMQGSNNTGTTNIRIYVPDESVEAYRAGAYWSVLASKIHPLSEYTGRYYR